VFRLDGSTADPSHSQDAAAERREAHFLAKDEGCDERESGGLSASSSSMVRTGKKEGQQHYVWKKPI
jgi:hypothetical protein